MTIFDEYENERERLERNRALDWSTFKVEYIVAGESLEPMTVQTWFDLLALNSPFLVGRNPTIEAVVDYIWRHSPKRTDSRLLREWRLFWLDHKVRKSLKKEEDLVVDVIRQHLQSQIDEFPSDARQAGTAKNNSMSSVSGEASMIDEIAHRYALHPDEVLDMPLRQAFALQRTIRISTIPDYKLLEPDSLREIKSRYIQSLNNG